MGKILVTQFSLIVFFVFLWTGESTSRISDKYLHSVNPQADDSQIRIEVTDENGDKDLIEVCSRNSSLRYCRMTTSRNYCRTASGRVNSKLSLKGIFQEVDQLSHSPKGRIQFSVLYFDSTGESRARTFRFSVKHLPKLKNSQLLSLLRESMLGPKGVRAANYEWFDYPDAIRELGRN